MAKKREHTFTVTVSAPAWATRAQVKREVRTLINDQANWGAQRYDARTGHPIGSIGEGDIKVRKMAPACRPIEVFR